MIKLFISGSNKYTDKLRAAAEAAARVLGQEEELSASVSFVPAQEIRELNLKFRGRDKPTDVLSFPNLGLKKPRSVKIQAVKATDWPLDKESGSVFLGDIVICKAVAKKQSAEYGHSEEKEIVYLFIHGLLHLFGFDHMDETDKEIMREAEEEILQCTMYNAQL